jgi:hypothetical protein
MDLATEIIIECFKENAKRALQEVLSVMAIVALVVVLIGVPLYLYNLPDPAPGIQSAEHRAEVAKHVGRVK